MQRRCAYLNDKCSARPISIRACLVTLRGPTVQPFAGDVYGAFDTVDKRRTDLPSITRRATYNEALSPGQFFLARPHESLIALVRALPFLFAFSFRHVQRQPDVLAGSRFFAIARLIHGADSAIAPLHTRQMGKTVGYSRTPNPKSDQQSRISST